MVVIFHKRFKKELKRLPKKVQDRFFFLLQLFQEEKMTVSLHDHSFSGKYTGYRSISVTGDYRAVYVVYRTEEEIVQFVRIGTHSELYG